MGELLEYATWLLQKAKTILRMSDKDLANVIGVSRPTAARLLKNPGAMTLGQLALLEDHLKTQAALLKAMELV